MEGYFLPACHRPLCHLCLQLTGLCSDQREKILRQVDDGSLRCSAAQ